MDESLIRKIPTPNEGIIPHFHTGALQPSYHLELNIEHICRTHKVSKKVLIHQRYIEQSNMGFYSFDSKVIERFLFGWQVQKQYNPPVKGYLRKLPYR